MATDLDRFFAQSANNTDNQKKPPLTPDPFEAMGGGVQTADGGWVPKDHPLAQSGGAGSTGTPLPVSPPPPSEVSAAPPLTALGTNLPAGAVGQSQPNSPDPFAAMGGGVWTGQQWVPKDHPLAQGLPGSTSSSTSTSSSSQQTLGQTKSGIGPPFDKPIGSQNIITGVGSNTTIGIDPQGNITGHAPGTDLGNTVENDPDQAAFRAKLIELLGTDQNKASITDPDIAPQADAYAAGRERARREQQRAQFERLNAGGAASSGAANSAVNDAYEQAGRDTGAYNAKLVGDKLTQRLDTLKSAMTMANQYGMAKEANNLQRQIANVNAQLNLLNTGTAQRSQDNMVKLANLDKDTKVYLAQLDADLRREGYSQAEVLARMDNELRKYGIDVQGNLGLLQTMVSMLGIQADTQQFNDTFGLDLAKFETGQNNGIINFLTGGS